RGAFLEPAETGLRGALLGCLLRADSGLGRGHVVRALLLRREGTNQTRVCTDVRGHAPRTSPARRESTSEPAPHLLPRSVCREFPARAGNGAALAVKMKRARASEKRTPSSGRGPAMIR